jgi:hypothetical protein
MTGTRPIRFEALAVGYGRRGRRMAGYELDYIGVYDRSRPLTEGELLE